MGNKLVLFLLFIIMMFVFIDSNMMRVPVKVLVGSPMMVSLGFLIIVSMVAGALIPITGYIIFRKKKKE